MDQFKILYREGKARVGKLKTLHGVIETPNFIPVGTQGTVKALSPRDLKEIGVQVVLSNTYHLMLRPGDKLIKDIGGLHRFMGWEGPIMTDSGGFQVLSLGVGLEHGMGKFLQDEYSSPKPRLNQITEEGVIFQSHLDGSKHTLTPKRSIQIQADLGVDLMVAFDDLESPKYNYKETLKSLELTEEWELKSLNAYTNYYHNKAKSGLDRPLLYGVTHGGVFKDLRTRSAKFVDKYFEGIALGGAHKDKKSLYQVVEWTIANVSEQKPKHLLGIGEVADLFECIERGVDLFDCVAPTRRARNGSLYISPKSGVYEHSSKPSAYKKSDYKKLNFTMPIRLSKFTKDSNPIDPSCNCYTCKNFSRAYLRHLFMAKEMLYHKLATYHNIYFINNLVTQIREAIKKGEFKKLKDSWLN